MSELYIFLVLGLIVGASALYTKLRKRVSASYIERTLEQLDDTAYQTVSAVKLPGTEMTIDHVIPSIYGVFVINRENWPGTVKGSATDQEWIFAGKKQEKAITNPFQVTEQSAKELAVLLSINAKYIHLIVTFTNSTKLAVDDSLMAKQQVCYYDTLIDAIKARKTPCLSKAKVKAFAEQLEALNSKAS